MPEQLTREQARRIAVRAQLLDARRPRSVLEVVQRLGFLQYDLTRAIAPSQDVILWSRLGDSYDRSDLQHLLDTQELIELHMVLRPASDIALYRAEMAAWPAAGTWEQRLADWAGANAACAEDILDQLRGDGPLPTTELPDTCAVPWRSSGWTHDKNVQKMLSALVARGEVALARREGAMPWWDLAERVYPDVPPVPFADAVRERNRRRLVAFGIARAKTVQAPVEPNDVGPVGVQATVEGVRGTWQVDPDQLERVDEPFEGRAALLSPLDRLVFDRKRLAEIFEFDYVLEMYKPAVQRIWGYWALPVLVGDRFIGKADVIAERQEGELIVHALYEDEPWALEQRAAVLDELSSLADWLDLALVLP
jgi:hypothetical protein